MKASLLRYLRPIIFIPGFFLLFVVGIAIYLYIASVKVASFNSIRNNGSISDSDQTWPDIVKKLNSRGVENMIADIETSLSREIEFTYHCSSTFHEPFPKHLIDQVTSLVVIKFDGDPLSLDVVSPDLPEFRNLKKFAVSSRVDWDATAHLMRLKSCQKLNSITLAGGGEFTVEPRSVLADVLNANNLLKEVNLLGIHLNPEEINIILSRPALSALLISVDKPLDDQSIENLFKQKSLVSAYFPKIAKPQHFFDQGRFPKMAYVRFIGQDFRGLNLIF